jgi:mannose-1-phosphate guanylyltransferase
MDGSNISAKGVVLAGGEGKRLRPLSYYFQKCMIPVGNKQKPLLEHVIRLLGYHGIIDILLLAGYKHEQIVNYFNSGERFGVNITCVLDDPGLKGTGGSLLNMYRRGLIEPHETLLVYYGDIISYINLTEMIERHCQRRAVATLALSRGYQVRVGVAEITRGDVTGWTEKPTLEINVGTGIVILNASVLQELEWLSERYEVLDVMSHLIPRLIEKGDVVHAYLTNAFWYDVGSTERYEKLDSHIIDQHLEYLSSKPQDISLQVE